MPAGYQEIDLTGKTIYPSFIDLHTSYGLPKVEQTRSGSPFGSREQISPVTKGAYNANDAIKSHYEATSQFTTDSKTGADFRMAGFGTVLTFRPDGLARGRFLLRQNLSKIRCCSWVPRHIWVMARSLNLLPLDLTRES